MLVPHAVCGVTRGGPLTRVLCEGASGEVMVGERIPEDAAAFFADEYDRLVGALGLYVGDRFVAEELAQEALLRACRRWERVSTMDSPGGWTWRVAVNLANSYFRRRRAERRAHARLAQERDPVSDGPRPTDSELVARAVASLPRRQKTALVLRYYLDLSVAETARRMGTSDDAVRSLTKRAVADLRRRVDLVDGVPMLTEADDGH